MLIRLQILAAFVSGFFPGFSGFLRVSPGGLAFFSEAALQIQKDRFASGLANRKGAMLSTMEGFWLNGTPRRSAFPSVRIEAGKRGAKAQKGFKTDIETTSASGGHVFTMASLVWLILYMLSPNCAQGKARVKQGIAER